MENRRLYEYLNPFEGDRATDDYDKARKKEGGIITEICEGPYEWCFGLIQDELSQMWRMAFLGITPNAFHKKASTVAAVKSHLNTALSPEFGKLAMGDIDSERVQAFLNRLARKDER